MTKYNFKKQEELLKIALQITDEFQAKEFSLGGGTILSAGYYNHRMSYDIDIFSEDFSFINTLSDNKKVIANNLGINITDVKASPGGITFVLSKEEAGLKLDFLHGVPITKDPYVIKDVLNSNNLKTQTVKEIIARKIKHRERVTIRDFIDFAYVQRNFNIIKELQSELHSIDVQRYIDIVDQFVNNDPQLFDREFKYMGIDFASSKEDIKKDIFSIIKAQNEIAILVDNTGEIVSIDNFIPESKRFYDEYGDTTTLKKITLAEITNKTNTNIQEILRY